MPSCESRLALALFSHWLTQASIWTAKFTVSEFLKRLTERFWKKGYERGLHVIRIFLVVTFFLVFIATLAECHPTTHYWQVVPDPGPQCRQGYAQLLTMGIADVITDILLVAFPIPIIIRSGMPLKRKLSLVALFSLSIILIVITGARMPLVIKRQGIQQFRTVFASSEILAAAIVSNAIVLGSFLRDRGIKKTKFKAPSTSDSMERRESARRFVENACSSDEDLARSLGYRTKPELLEKTVSLPRPAPVADLEQLSSANQSGPFANNRWTFPGPSISTLQAAGDRAEDLRDPMPSPRCGRRVSWFDVGGLLENTVAGPSPNDSVITHDFAAHPGRGSRASNTISSNHRAFPLPARHSSRRSQQSVDLEWPLRPRLQSQDRRGLSEDCEAGGSPSAPSAPSAHSGSPVRSSVRQDPTTLRRSSTRTSYDFPSIRDPGGLLLTRPPSASTQRNPTRSSYDVPSLPDTGDMLSSPSLH